MRIMITILGLLIIHQVHGVQTTSLELHQIDRTNLDSESSLLVTRPIEELQRYLQKLPQLESILLTQAVLRKLSELGSPTSEQIEWVEEQGKSELKLVMPSAEHPQNLLTIVDVSQQANTTKLLWVIKKTANQIQTQWDNGTFAWGDYFDHQSVNTHRALVHWLQTIDQPILVQVTEHFNEFGLPKVTGSNEVLAVIAKRTLSQAVVEALLARPADEFTYQAIRTLPGKMSETEALSVLQFGLNNKAIRSQVLLKLATHYSHHESAQQMFENALKTPKLKWLAAASLSRIKDQRFKDKLIRRYATQSSPVAALARKSLAKEASL